MKTVAFFLVLVAIALLTLVLYGCGGEAFTTAETLGVAGVADDGAAASTGGATGSGGHATGGASTGGVAVATGGSDATGGAPSSTGGVASTGGVPSSTGGAVVATGGAPVVDACALVTHDNGAGQMWQDCVPLGTYNAEQASKACKAWCAVNIDCTCTMGVVDVLGNGGAEHAMYGSINGVYVIWLWEAPHDGDTMRAAPKNTPWGKIGAWD